MNQRQKTHICSGFAVTGKYHQHLRYSTVRESSMQSCAFMFYSLRLILINVVCLIIDSSVNQCHMISFDLMMILNAANTWRWQEINLFPCSSHIFKFCLFHWKVCSSSWTWDLKLSFLPLPRPRAQKFAPKLARMHPKFFIYPTSNYKTIIIMHIKYCSMQKINLPLKGWKKNLTPVSVSQRTKTLAPEAPAAIASPVGPSETVAPKTAGRKSSTATTSSPSSTECLWWNVSVVMLGK